MILLIREIKFQIRHETIMASLIIQQPLELLPTVMMIMLVSSLLPTTHKPLAMMSIRQLHLQIQPHHHHSHIDPLHHHNTLDQLRFVDKIVFHMVNNSTFSVSRWLQSNTLARWVHCLSIA